MIAAGVSAVVAVVLFGAAVVTFLAAVVVGMVSYQRFMREPDAVLALKKRSRTSDALGIASAWLLLAGVAWLTAALLVASVSALVGAVLS